MRRIGDSRLFQAPFGTLWLEQTAMFFDLLALLAVPSGHRGSLTATGKRILARSCGAQ
jgi:hypothetical protein